MQKYLQIEFWQNSGNQILSKLVDWLTSPQFYAQIAVIVGAIFLAVFVSRILKRRVAWFSKAPPKKARWLKFRQYLHAASDLLLPALFYIFLGFAVEIANATVEAD